MTKEEMAIAIKDALRQSCSVPWAEWCSEPTHRGLREVIKALEEGDTDAKPTS